MVASYEILNTNLSNTKGVYFERIVLKCNALCVVTVGASADDYLNSTKGYETLNFLTGESS
jgi:hypothetical protein